MFLGRSWLWLWTTLGPLGGLKRFLVIPPYLEGGVWIEKVETTETHKRNRHRTDSGDCQCILQPPVYFP